MIRLFDDLEQARNTVLRRRGPVREAWSKELLAGIERVFAEPITPPEAVARILADVRQRGDEALREWTAKTDGVDLDALDIPQSAWEEAYARISPSLVQAMEMAAERIRAFHACQPISSWTTCDLGGQLGQRVQPLDRVGVYVPGGTAPLPSSLLMAAVPARVAGVRHVIVCTPPGTAAGGRVDDVTLAAAQIAGVDAVFAVGGAQAIGPMTFGTEAISRVDKIVGAGGLFVTLAKRHVYGFVGLDGVHGPTETVVVADDSANPVWVASDLLAQAEHDPLATAILLTPSGELAVAVQREVRRQLDDRERADILRASLEGQGGIVVTPDLATAVGLADEFAPEHLCLSVRDAEQWAQRVRNAGGLFLGEHSFEVLGDYVAGPSHIMPTGGTARFSSPLNVLDFVKITSIIALDPTTAGQLCGGAAQLALAESLDGHAAAATQRKGTVT